MAGRQNGLSRTLPKNFTFSSTGLGEPRTPERASTHLGVPPPPPRHSSCRLRRSRVRSGTDVFAEAQYDLSTSTSNQSDVPLPSIEFPFNDAFTGSSYPTVPSRDDRFLAPPRDRLAMKTPPAQIRPDPVEETNSGSWYLHDSQALGESIQRPSSACSQASDSSVSSIETFSSRRSAGGSCTSMEEESYDPFFHLELPSKQTPETPTLSHTRKNKARSRPFKERWTLPMDNHLWNTYQVYLQDPTITPFKMTPGSIPPLGVAHRVAREAKRSWERRRFRPDGQFPMALSSHQRPSNHSTPTPRSDLARQTWPKSEASTRRRLKFLCRKKFSIAPHYQRMMQSKSPTPFLDVFSNPTGEPARPEAPINSSTAYATRDLGVSLVSSYVPGPLAKLATEGPSPQEVSNEWFNNPVLSEGYETMAAPPTIHAVASAGKQEPVPRLGSPFTYNSWGPSGSKKRLHRHTPRNRRETIHVTGSRLRSPPRMETFPHLAPYAGPTSEFPAEQDTDEQLEDLLRHGKLNHVGQHRIRIRNRGATTSAVNHQGLDQLFSPPSSSSRNEDIIVEKPVANALLNLGGENIKRLGSPFKLEVTKRPQPSPRRIRHAPSFSDPFASGLLPPLDSTSSNSQPQNQGMTGVPLYDPTGKDVECSRTPILNTPHSRQ
ncbi:hypothetical protein BO94DRAFT_583804 [Aspergillus sclerotioniger CBS 115572]|uniref:Uncharacterized protein n=1 Tax=Aspergillus sclerotioniger CBS 115572 TaxID=1450535 RepID=A0A317WZR8_9EURO|nr:hypothetical protein BO94DRAFT_583804 [Aspergillus sclerotioniger CBS 115572]PWY91886.1 hypothetical protein BO94DRAFT_583804 [Aspergillus sclerotioniger CBS 115572]